MITTKDLKKFCSKNDFGPSEFSGYDPKDEYNDPDMVEFVKKFGEFVFQEFDLIDDNRRVVLSFKDTNQHFMTDYYYNSWEGDDWDGKWFEAEGYQFTETRYRKKKKEKKQK